MRVYCYFVEPASYTLDLASNIYDNNSIDYSFIKSNTLAVSDSKLDKIYLDQKTIINKLKFVYLQFKKNDFIIINGYNNYPFIITFLLNFLTSNKRHIAIESDTQLSVPKNPIKRFIKWLYLSLIFRNKYVLGFAGGSKMHKDLFRCYGMRENRIFLMPMMVDNNRFFNKSRSEGKESFIFLYAGRLIKRKNIESLIK